MISRGLKSIGKDLYSSIKFKINDTRDANEVRIKKTKLDQIDSELNNIYMQYGRAVYNCEAEDQINSLKDLIDVRVAEQIKLEDQIGKLENIIAQKKLLEEREDFELNIQKEKKKLKKALNMSIISEQEYEKEISVLDKLLIHFMDIRRIQEKYEIGIITEEERDIEINNLN